MQIVNELIDIGVAHYFEKNFVGAKICFLRAIEHPSFQSLEAPSCSLAWYNLGATCWELNASNKLNFEEKVANLEQGIEGYVNCLKIDPDKNNLVTIGLIGIQIMYVWCLIEKDLTKSLETFLNAKTHMEKIHVNKMNRDIYQSRVDELELLERHLLSSLGDKKYDEGNHEAAIKYYTDAIRLLETMTQRLPPQERLNNLRILADTYHNLAECHIYLNQKPQALYNFSLANSLYLQMAQHADKKSKKDLGKEKIIVENILLKFEEFVADKLAEKNTVSLPSSKIDSHKPQKSVLRKRKEPDTNDLDSNSQNGTYQKGTSTASKTIFFAKKQKLDLQRWAPKCQEELDKMDNSQLQKYLATLKEVYSLKKQLLDFGQGSNEMGFQ